jgi:4-amino-4-deoxy-L-arabinose transferase-like glycosyltransferase
MPSSPPRTPPAASPQGRTHTRILAVLFLVALGVRAAMGVWAAGHGEMEGLAWRYHEDALCLAAGYGLVHAVEGRPRQLDLIAVADSLARRGERLTPARVPPKDPAAWRPSSLHPPGYALFLLGVYRLFGEPMLVWAKALQAILDAFACLLVYALGRRFVSPGAGLVAAAAYAVFPPLAYLVTSRIADGLMPFFQIATFSLFVRALSSGRMRWYAAAGLVLGLACLLRPDSLLLPAFLLLGAIAVRGFRARTLIGMAALAAATFAAVLPWGLRNLRVMGTFQVTSSAGGMTLYQSLGQFPNRYGVPPYDTALSDSARRLGFESLDDPAADRYFKRRFLTIVRNDPGLLIGEMLRRVPLGIAPLYRWGYRNPAYAGHSFYDYVARHHLSAYQAILRHPLEVLAAYWDRLLFGVVSFGLFTGGIALVVAERRRWAVALLLQIPYLYLFASHLPLVLGARLLLPGIFGQLVILGYWWERLVRRRPVALREI